MSRQVNPQTSASAPAAGAPAHGADPETPATPATGAGGTDQTQRSILREAFGVSHGTVQYHEVLASVLERARVIMGHEGYVSDSAVVSHFIATAEGVRARARTAHSQGMPLKAFDTSNEGHYRIVREVLRYSGASVDELKCLEDWETALGVLGTRTVALIEHDPPQLEAFVKEGMGVADFHPFINTSSGTEVSPAVWHDRTDTNLARADERVKTSLELLGMVASSHPNLAHQLRAWIIQPMAHVGAGVSAQLRDLLTEAASRAPLTGIFEAIARFASTREGRLAIIACQQAEETRRLRAELSALTQKLVGSDRSGGSREAVPQKTVATAKPARSDQGPERSAAGRGPATPSGSVNEPPPARARVRDDSCRLCKEVGHYARNCPDRPCRLCKDGLRISEGGHFPKECPTNGPKAPDSKSTEAPSASSSVAETDSWTAAPAANRPRRESKPPERYGHDSPGSGSASSWRKSA